MTRVILLTGVAAGALAGGMASAAGVERTPFSSAILFEEGTYAEFSIGRVEPDVSGTQVTTLGGALPGAIGAASGDVAPGYTTFSLGVKTQATDRVSLAFTLDQPIGAAANYDTAGYVYAGSIADLDANAATLLARYRATDAISVYGGVRALQTKGAVTLFNGYSLDTSRETDFGYLLGAAYEMPEIALRVALTYQSKITHDFDSQEFIPTVPATVPGEFAVEIPQTVTLEFQSGVAEDTLVFGSVRWADWSEFEITPPNLGAALVDYQNDTWTYSLGVGRRFTETWAGAVTASYEPGSQDFTSNLGPNDGVTSLGLAATYTKDNWEVTAGARYLWIGDADTSIPGTGGTGPALGAFRDNSGYAVGLKVAYTY